MWLDPAIAILLAQLRASDAHGRAADAAERSSCWALRITDEMKQPGMLILTRRVGEKLIITTEDGQRIQVTVLGTKGNQVPVGVQAPDQITILREELNMARAAGAESPD